jgi:hypothetical protein
VAAMWQITIEGRAATLVAAEKQRLESNAGII